jgi:EmrB/QacA subfamily drug resistance transporter
MEGRPLTDRDSNAKKQVALLVASLSSFLTPFIVAAINVALPSIGKDLSLDAVLLGWVTTSYLLAAATSLVPFGKVADVVGRKRIFTAGVSLFVLSSLAAAVAPSGGALVGCRVAQGLSGAMMASTIVAILTSVYPPEERGRALGMNTAATYVGLSVGPLIGGLLTQQLGWRSIFLVNVPLGLVVFGLVVWKLEGEWRGGEPKRFDVLGSVIYGLSLVAVMYGLSVLPVLAGVWFICGGTLGLVAFVLWEARVQNPLLHLELFRHNRLFALSNMTALLTYVGTFAVGFLLSLYLQYIKGLTPQQAGLILVAQPVVMAAVSPLAGRLSDRVEPRVVASVGLALMIVGLMLLASLGFDASLSFVVSSLILFGLGFALFSSPNINAIMGAVEKQYYGVASAVTGTMRLMGQMLSMGIATLVLAVYIGKVEITPERYPIFLTSMRVALLVFAGLCVVSVSASLARGKVRQRSG